MSAVAGQTRVYSSLHRLKLNPTVCGGVGGGGIKLAWANQQKKMYFQQKLYVAKATKSGMLSHTTCISTQTHANNAALLWQKKLQSYSCPCPREFQAVLSQPLLHRLKVTLKNTLVHWDWLAVETQMSRTRCCCHSHTNCPKEWIQNKAPVIMIINNALVMHWIPLWYTWEAQSAIHEALHFLCTESL